MIDYHRYMASRQWALKKEAVKERSGGDCERCKEAPHQNTHHVSYKHLGNEPLDDLQGVCRPCHEYLSGKREHDPAVQLVLRLIETTGLTPAMLWDCEDHTPHILHWSTGPTANGHSFHGDLKTTDKADRWWDDHMDDAIIVVPIAPGIWYHCNSY